MASGFPRFKLYQENGSTLVYEFENILDYGDGIFLDPTTFSRHTSLRGQGSIISDGSETDWELPLEFYLTGDDYEDLIAQEKNITNLIQKNIKYVLRVDLTISTTEDLKVKRLIPIRFPITNDKSKVIRSQKGFITLLVNSWV